LIKKEENMMKKCNSCNGSGIETIISYSIEGIWEKDITCSECDGTGKENINE
jgi:DnaJ-class molecular chaperone